MEVVGHGVVVDLADAAFLRADSTGKVAEVVGRQWNISVQGFADRLPIVDGFHIGQQFAVGIDAVGNLQQNVGAFGGAGFAPNIGRGVGSIQCFFNIRSRAARRLGVDLAGDGRDHVKVLASCRWNPLAANVVVVVGLILVQCTRLSGELINHDSTPFR